MRIETNLQPNCSELGLRLNTEDVSKAVKILRKIGLKVVVSYKDKDYIDMAPSLIGLIIDKFRSIEGQAGKVERFAKVKEIPEELKEVWLADDRDIHEVGVYVEDKKGCTAQLQRGDYCIGGRLVTLQIGDCDREKFPLFKYVEDNAKSEVYGIDGGHMDRYEEYKESHHGR